MTMGLTLYRVALLVIYAGAVVVFVSLFFVTAPYGRHARPGWGLTIPEKWGWGVMESPSVLIVALVFAVALLRTGSVRPIATLFFLLWEVHYVYRTFVFTSLMRQGSRRFPLLIAFFAILFNVLNAYVNGYYLFFLPSAYTVAWLIDPRFLVGLVIFAAGFVTHVGSDRVLRLLRNGGRQDYSIPYGGMFRFVSCPNYLGELVEWAGWAVMTWSPAGLAFAVFTFANLFPRAISNHRWYLETFGPEYPQDRKALIPFVL